jgi:hypothetical protein
MCRMTRLNLNYLNYLMNRLNLQFPNFHLNLMFR